MIAAGVLPDPGDVVVALVLLVLLIRRELVRARIGPGSAPRWTGADLAIPPLLAVFALIAVGRIAALL